MTTAVTLHPYRSISLFILQKETWIYSLIDIYWTYPSSDDYIWLFHLFWVRHSQHSVRFKHICNRLQGLNKENLAFLNKKKNGLKCYTPISQVHQQWRYCWVVLSQNILRCAIRKEIFLLLRQGFYIYIHPYIFYISVMIFPEIICLWEIPLPYFSIAGLLWVNSLWPAGAIWRHGTLSTLFQIKSLI